MQTIIISALFLIMMVGCDAPTRNRYPTVPEFNSGDVSFGSGGFTNGGTGDNITEGGSGTGGSGGDSGSGGSGDSQQQGYEHCSLATTIYGGTMGYFGLCQHSQDERGFKFKFTMNYTCQGGNNQSTNCGSCFIPMHLGTSGSFALGPAQCVHNQAGQEYYGTFQKARNEQINSIMVIHRYSVDSFFQCMGAYDQYLSQCYGGAANPSCVQAASNYANQVCQSFVSTHRNHYKQVNFN